MAQIFVFGRVENDLIPKKSQKGSTYVSFRLSERTGKGQFQHYQVWAWDKDVERLGRLGIKEGSLIWLTGSQQLVDCTSDQGKVPAKILKVYLSNFGFVPGQSFQNGLTDSPDDHETACNPFPSPAGVVDGEQEPLPE